MRGVGIEGNGYMTIVGSDDEKDSFKVSEDTARAFTRDESKVRSEAVAQTFSDGRGLDYLANVAKRIGATEAYSIIDEARSISRSQESYGADLTTALVRNYARERYGEETPETIRKTISNFNSYVTQHGVAGVNNMNAIVSGFVSGNGYGWGSTQSEVQGAIHNARNRIHDQGLMKGFVDQTTGSARSNTTGITEGSIQPLESHLPLQEQSGTRTITDANNLRSVNRHEESGQGRIRTDAKGMASEGIGKVFKGVVDSQGNRPTPEGYLQAPPENKLAPGEGKPGAVVEIHKRK